MTHKFDFTILLFTLLSFAITKSAQSQQLEAGMVKVTILYPNGDDKTFDMDYYEKKHMPMVAGLLGKNLRFYEIDKGIAGRNPTEKIPFLAVGYFYVKDLAEYNKVIVENINTIRADFKNYTNIQPVVQVSEVRLVKSNDAK